MNSCIKVTALCLLVLLVACGKQDVEQKPVVQPVKAMVVGNGGNERLRKFPAVVEATNDVEMTFKVAGEITSLMVVAGQEVEAGQLLAKLDPKDYQIAVNQAKANFDLAKSTYVRMQKMHAQKLISIADFDQARANYEVATAAYDSAKQNLTYTELHAPFAGQVSRLFIDNYENITPKQPILELIEQGTVDIVIQVPELFVSRVKKDVEYQPTVIFDTHKKQRYKASIKEYDSQSDPVTKTYRVVFSVKEPEDFNVLPGMTATIIIETQKVFRQSLSSVTLPSQALFSSDSQVNQQHFVWVIGDDMLLEKREVFVSGFMNNGVAISKGLLEGDRVVVAGVHRLKEKQQVSIWNKERGL